MASNKNLHKAKTAKNDEFYTQLSDIELEVFEYVDIRKGINPFKDKVILCPCDDPATSNFTLFFAMNFERLGLKKLISTSYAKEEGGHGRVYTVDHDVTGDGVVDQDDIEFQELEGDGDFRSDEVRALREEADIIVTNPPFSQFRDFVSWINPDEKQFLIMGNMNAITYKEVFPLIKENKMWLGLCSNKTVRFELPPDAEKFTEEEDGVKYANVPAICWYTNITHRRRSKPMSLIPKHLILGHKFCSLQKYDNYDAIEVPKILYIPRDYDGVMGVPISFLCWYCPEQFELLGHEHDLPTGESISQFNIDGKPVYKRILIKKK